MKRTDERLKKAVLLHQQGNLPDAAKHYRQLIEEDPRNFQALHFLGVIESVFGNMEQARTLMARSLNVRPQNIQFIENYATILFQSGDYKSALETCRQGLQLNDANAGLLYVAAISSFKLNQLEESLQQFDRLLSIQPNHIAAINERGTVLAELRQYPAAFASFETALRLNPNYPEALLNIANLYATLDCHDEAAAGYGRALALKPDLADAWLGLGNVFFVLTRLDDASAAYGKALALKPDLAGAWHGRGNVAFEFKRYDEALAAYAKALEIKPDFAEAASARLHTKMHLCDWTDYESECERLISSVRNGRVTTSPFAILGIPTTSADHLQCAKRYVADKYPARPPVWQGERYNHDRIRIAYLSTDYRIHAIAYLVSELLELHDRTKFEVIGISLGPDDHSDMRTRIAESFDQFHDMRGKSDQEAAQIMRRLEIDIAVDLNNYSGMCRPGILAHRPAPVQASYLGYPSTMGADFIDYAIVDKFVLPDDQQKYWTEKFVYMPDSYLVHDTKTKRNMPHTPPTRAEAGLPDNAFVFCCFNNAFKITPPVFQVWMRLLKAVEGSVAWLSSAGAPAQLNLRNEAERAGVDPDRLIVAPRLDRVEDHLSRHRAADLFLDTLPYNAHTTAADALWAGLPVVTCAGETFPARVAGSLLHAIGLPELVTNRLQDYEALALQLAHDPARLMAIKTKLARNRDTHALFDTARFTRHLEAAYDEMVARHRRGEAPAPFAVEPIV